MVEGDVHGRGDDAIFVGGLARGLEEVGAAVVVVERDLEVDAAVAQIDSLLADPDTLARMSVSAKGQGHLDTAKQVAGLLAERFLALSHRLVRPLVGLQYGLIMGQANRFQ